MKTLRNALRIALYGFCFQSCFMNLATGTQLYEKEYNMTQTVARWETNAHDWDEKMAEGSPFQKELVEPKTLEFLAVQPEMKILDIACGNGQMSRCLANLGAQVTAFDSSKAMIQCAQQRSRDLSIIYKVADVTKPAELQFLDASQFDAVLCNMALMDIVEIKPVFQLAYKVLKPRGTFVFSITHPCFDKAVGPHMTETHENEGQLDTVHSIKVERYLTPHTMKVRALPSLPSTHFFFHRSQQDYLDAAFAEGFVMTGFAEPSFPKVSGLTEHKGWHKLSEIPVVFIAKFKK